MSLRLPGTTIELQPQLQLTLRPRLTNFGAIGVPVLFQQHKE